MAKEKYWDGTKWVQVAPSMQEFDEHLAEVASTMKKGHVQLSSAVTSTDETKAATSKAVKTAMDRADAAFTSASNGKTLVGNAITGVDDSVLIPTAPSYQQLADAIGSISTGKKWASGSGVASGSTLVVSGLSFTPSTIVATQPTNDSSAIFSNNGALNFVINKSLYSLKEVNGSNVHTIQTNGFTLNSLFSVHTGVQWVAFE